MKIAKTLSAPSMMALVIGAFAAFQPGMAVAQDAAAEDTGALEDIVVTAQRRDENIQDVPVSVTAANAESLAAAGITNVSNLNNLSPSISFRSTNIASSTSNIQIRGIGTVGNARTFEGAVGVFIDGVYRTRSGQALSNFLDVAGLQILRGPQGTLFGKNTSAGAVLINSTRPELGAVNGNIEASYGNYDTYLTRGAVNLPVGDMAALRLAAVFQGTGGTWSNPNGGHLNGNDDWGVKGQFLVEPTDSIRVLLIGDYARSKGDCCYATWNSVDGATQPLIDAFTLANGLKLPSKKIGDREAVVNPLTINRSKDYGATLRAEFDIGNGTLASVSAIRGYTLYQLQDADFSGARILDLDENFDSRFRSQELTYSGKIEGGISADYVIGAFYSAERLRMSRNLRWDIQAQTYWDNVFAASSVPAGTANAAPGLFTNEKMGGKVKSLAFFTHWNVNLTDQLSAIVGARYTNERKTGYQFTQNFRDALFDPLALAGVMPGIPYDLKTKNNSLSGTLGLQYKPNEDVNVYATFNRGFKAGGVNLDVNAAGVPGSVVFGSAAILQSPIYKPETINGFELGAKVDWMGGRARTNAAVFYNSIKNLQVAQFLGLQFQIINAPKAKVYGFEIEQTFKLSDALTLNGGVTWLPEANFGAAPILLNLSKRRFSTAPKFAGNLTLSLEQPINDSMALTARVQTLYTSKVFDNPVNDLTQGGYALVNMNLGLKQIDSNWQIEAFMNNVFDKDYTTAHFNTPLQGDDRNAYLGQPRTYGVTLRGRF